MVHVIARMNVGGPAHHVALIAARLRGRGWETTLLMGRPADDEAEFEPVLRREGLRAEVVPHLTPAISPVDDLRALRELVLALRRLRPAIVDTHTAKAGALGRLAALLAGKPRPLIVHTYHGHVLTGYFGRAVTAAYRFAERGLARVSARLVVVSAATAEELLGLGVGRRAQYRVVPLGLELDELLALDPSVEPAARAAVGAGPEDVSVVYVGRLAPIKRVDVLLRAFAAAAAEVPALRLAVVGDGAERAALEALAAQLGVAERVTFHGFRFDLAAIAAGTDIAVLTSDNEGTPVSLIEAAAAARPCVGTRVGGVEDIVTPEAGLLAPPGDHAALAEALVALARDPARRRTMGLAGREHVRRRFGADRVVDDVEALYRELLA